MTLTACILLSAPGSTHAETREAEHGAWTVRCEALADGVRERCIMFQNLVLATGGQTVLQFAIGIAPVDNQPTVLMSLPLGISLPPGVAIRIDGGRDATFPIERCEPDGCQAGMKIREQTVQQLSAGRNLDIVFHDGNRQPISVQLSLAGFAESFAVLRAAAAPP